MSFLVRARPCVSLFQRRAFAAPANAVLLDRSEVQTRVLQVLQSHSFVNSAKLGPHASLVHDLGLDELHLEQLTGALKNEFCVEVQPAGSVDGLVASIAGNPLAK